MPVLLKVIADTDDDKGCWRKNKETMSLSTSEGASRSSSLFPLLSRQFRQPLVRRAHEVTSVKDDALHLVDLSVAQPFVKAGASSSRSSGVKGMMSNQTTVPSGKFKGSAG